MHLFITYYSKWNTLVMSFVVPPVYQFPIVLSLFLVLENLTIWTFVGKQVYII